MKKISEIEKNLDKYLNEDTLFFSIPVYDTSLDEMSKVGKIPNTSLEIHIEGGEGYIPHMHICKKSGKNIVLRLKLLTNGYFREKDDKLNTLNSNERKALNDYLKSNIPFSKDTMWTSVIQTWNRFNSSHMVNPYTMTQPDYSTINEPGGTNEKD